MHQEEDAIGRDIDIHLHQRRHLGKDHFHASDRILDGAAAMGGNKGDAFAFKAVEKAVKTGARDERAA
ncbi:hypothetical protein GCM10011342_24480 [Aquisalinus flavus]|uniref:Uncharacterized protein n=1 Tax=Aquisalinus flavus TaxID=1526572 RepID=A0A8J2Y6V0_9PROT|nr:hypothetical protein GCM10011342_24480 [Aquisalinus flavus]